MALVKYCAGVALIFALAAAAPTPSISGGIQNDIINVVNTNTDIDVDGDDRYYDHYHNVDPDPLHHVYYETGPRHKRQIVGGIQNDEVNVVNTETDVDVDFDNHHDRDFWIARDPDAKHHYYHDGHWDKRDVAAPEAHDRDDFRDFGDYEWYRENDSNYWDYRYYDGDPKHYWYRGEWYYY